MKKLSINKIRNRSAHVAASALVVFAAALAVSALMAQSPSKAQTKKALCKAWFEKLSVDDKQKIHDAFEKALNDSALETPYGQKLRNQLLDARDCYKAPKAAVQKILDDLNPGGHLNFPKDALIVFYEPEEPNPTPPPANFRDWYASEHCLQIFYLPEVGSHADKASFQQNLMCCYKPW
jgi:hypothetical protein